MSIGNTNPIRRITTSVTSQLENLSEETFAYILLVPTFLVISILAFWPLFRTLQLSLFADNLLTQGIVGDFVGVENYVKLLNGDLNTVLPRPFFDMSRPFQSALTVTVIITVVSVSIETVLGLAQALILDREFRGRRWTRVALIIPWAVPIAIHGMIWYLMFVPGIGFAAEPFQALGIFSDTPLVNSSDAAIIIIIGDIWKTTAFMTLLILAGMQSIDRNLYSVAKVSGASKWQRFKLITFPLILPTLLIAMLFRTMQAMRIFGAIETVSSCSVVPSLSCLVVLTFRSQRYGTSAAIAFATAAIIGIGIVAYLFQLSRTRGGI